MHYSNGRKLKIASILAIIGMMLMPFASAQMGPGSPQMSLPELEISAIQFSDADAIEGQDIIISVTVQNLNSTLPVSNVTLSLYLDYEVVQNFTGIELAASESASFDYIWQSESGTHNITAVLSVNGVPLPQTQASESLSVDLGEPLTPVLAILFLMLAILVIAAFPSIVKRIRT